MLYFLCGAYHLLISHLVPGKIHNDLQRYMCILLVTYRSRGDEFRMEGEDEKETRSIHNVLGLKS